MSADHAEIMAAKQRLKHVQAWQRYPFLGIPLVSEGPVIDGQVNVREWTCAASVGYVLHMAKGMMVRDRATWRLCYTDSHLYLAFQFERPESARAPSVRDFFELLFDVNHDHKRYYNLAATLEKKLWDGIGPNVDKKAWTPEWDYQARVTEFGWEGEAGIPFAEFHGLDRAPTPGTIWGVDLVRNERTPSDRLAHWSWRSRWHATKDLAHVMFTGKPLAVRTQYVGWMPQFKKIGVKLAVSNFGDRPVEVGTSLAIRRAEKPLTMEYLPALDSALTEDLDAAIGAEIDKEVQRALELFSVREQSADTVRIPARTTRQVALTIPDEPGNYLVSFELTEREELLAGMTVPFVVTVPLDITLKSYLFSASMLAYTVDLRRVQDGMSTDSTLAVVARLGKDREPVARQAQEGIFGKEEATGELRFNPTPGSTYYVTAVVRSDKKEVARNSAPLMLPDKPDWIGNSVGRSKLIPRPFTPLVAGPTRCEALTTRYDWHKDSIFPNVKVKGKEILAAPLALTIEDGAGVEAPIEVTSFELKSRNVEQAVYEFEASVRAIGTLSGTVKVEFDGFVWYDLTLKPRSLTELSRCAFRAKLKNEYARIYTRGRMAKGMGDLTAPGANCGAIPAEGLAFPYAFQTWIGYVEGGLQWYCESARNWHNDDPKRAIRIEPGREATSLVVNFVDTGLTIDRPMDWHFGFIPTPARVKMGGTEDHAYFQLAGIPDVERPDPSLKQADPKKYRERLQRAKLLHEDLAANGVKTVILFSSYNDMFGYPGIKDAEKRQRLHKFVDFMHSQAINVLVYNGWGISTKCPEWEQFGSELVNLPIRNSGYSTYWASPVSLYPDLFLYRLREHMQEFDLDGIYMDSTTSVSFSTHPNGMRWTDAKGKPRGSYPVRAMRDFTKRIYRALNGEVVDGGIYYNHHSPPANVCVENFVNVRCPSEFAQFYDGELDDAFVDFFLAKNGGIQYGFHTELTNKNWMRGIQKSINELNTIAIPTGVSFKTINFAPWTKRDYSRMAQPQHRIWQAMAWLGSASAEHLPWWRNRDYISTEPQDGVLTSIWLRKGEKALMCVSNLPNEARTITARLNLAAMGFGDVVVEDTILDRPVTIDDGVIRTEIEPRRWRLWKIRRR